MPLKYFVFKNHSDPEDYTHPDTCKQQHFNKEVRLIPTQGCGTNKSIVGLLGVAKGRCDVGGRIPAQHGMGVATNHGAVPDQEDHEVIDAS